jgi:hypothetical protein
MKPEDAQHYRAKCIDPRCTTMVEKMGLACDEHKEEALLLIGVCGSGGIEMNSIDEALAEMADWEQSQTVDQHSGSMSEAAFNGS